MAKFGLKATHQRMVIYEALMKRKDHPTAEIIYEVLHKDYPSLSKGTIYKTLETLVSVRLINKVLTDKGVFRFDANTGRHNHLYCTNTGEILDFDNEELSNIVRQFLNAKNIKNFTIKDIQVQINGEKNNPLEEVEIN